MENVLHELELKHIFRKDFASLISWCEKYIGERYKDWDIRKEYIVCAKIYFARGEDITLFILNYDDLIKENN